MNPKKLLVAAFVVVVGGLLGWAWLGRAPSQIARRARSHVHSTSSAPQASPASRAAIVIASGRLPAGKADRR